VSRGALPPAGFDPALAAHPTRRLPLTDVVDLLDLTHAPDVVARYRERMAAGDLFPPVAVVRMAGRFLLADGHKRLAAYRGLGVSEIVVEVWPLRRWLQDQAGQAARNAGKNRRILVGLVRGEGEALDLARGTARHWKRVVLSLARRASRSSRSRRSEG
jgi:hypothetical protein